METQIQKKKVIEKDFEIMYDIRTLKVLKS